MNIICLLLMQELSSLDIEVVQPKALYFNEGPITPNNPDLPVLIYKEVIRSTQTHKSQIFQHHFEKHDWHGTWKGVIFDYNHFHTTSHEALAIARGHISLHLGGENGQEIKLESGDLLILPAGTGHQMISQSESLVVIGSYPKGQEKYDICRSLTENPSAKERISSLSLPDTDPFYGRSGPLMALWSNKLKN